MASKGRYSAAAGGNVTVLDNSPKQLDQDRQVAEREHLDLATVEGDMADLSMFSDECFDIVVHPVSNVFAADVRPVWIESFRVLRHSGVLIAGFCNPVIFLFDYEEVEANGSFELCYSLPYSSVDHIDDRKLREYEKEGIPLEFGHTLQDQIGGQIAAGFAITGFYEDYDQEGTEPSLRSYMPTFIATRALKP